MLVTAGTCQSVGCTVDSQHPHDIIDGINEGNVEIPAVSSSFLALHLDDRIVT